VRGDETLARLPLRAQDGCEGASFMACAHIEGGEVHSLSVAAIAGAFYASISLFEQDPSRIGFSFEPRLWRSFVAVSVARRVTMDNTDCHLWHRNDRSPPYILGVLK
jgi:hypothetical protein